MDSEFEIYGSTDTGRCRKNNEDNFICQTVWDESHLLLAAIDGIGGYEGGEVASAIARDVIIDYVGHSSPRSKLLDVIKQAVVEANNAIVRAKEDDARLAQMGCVVTAALIDVENRLLTMAHVGDSRLYSFHDGRLVKLSHDHSIVGYREEIGDLTEEEAMHHPQRNLIERSCGDVIHMFEDSDFIDAAIFPIADGETQFLFCSDGLSDMLRSDQIAAVLAAGLPVSDEVEMLIRQANEAGGKDNVTVVIGRIVMPERPVESDIEDYTSDIQPMAVDPKNDDSIDEIVEPITQSEKEAPTGEPRRRWHQKIPMRVKRMLPWVLVVILLGVIAALVIGSYVKKIEDETAVVIPEQIVVESEPLINELDTTLATSGDSTANARDSIAKSADSATVRSTHASSQNSNVNRQ